MTHDLMIRNGTIVDGRGAEPFVGDVAVSGQVIAENGVPTGARPGKLVRDRQPAPVA